MIRYFGSIFILIILFSSCRTMVLSPLERGVIFNKHKGLDTTKVLGEGLNKYSFSEKIIVYDISEKQEEFSMICELADKSQIVIDFSVRYAPNQERLPQLYHSYRQNYRQNFLIPQIRNAARDTLKHYNPSELSFDFIEKILLDKLNQDLEIDDFITFRAFILRKISFPGLIQKAIDSGLQNEVENLKSNDTAKRMLAIENLLDNGSNIAIEIILNHWSTERDESVKKLIINGLTR